MDLQFVDMDLQFVDVVNKAYKQIAAEDQLRTQMA